MNLLPYTPDRREEIVELMNVSLGRTETVRRDVDYWIWKHERNPFGPSIVLMAEVDGRLAGVRAFMRWRLRVGDEILQAAKPVDSVTHPDFQRQGIFSRLTRAACEEAQRLGVRLLFNTPNQNSLPGYLKLGWREIGGLSLRARAIHPLRAAWRIALRDRRTSATAPEVFRPGAEPVPAAEFFSEEPGGIQFVHDREDSRFIRSDCDLAFLRWRYAEHPHLQYYVETIERGHGVADALVFRMNRRSGLDELLIDDAVFSSSEPNAMRELTDKLRRRVDADYQVLHSGERAPISAAARSAGFHKVPGKRIQLVGRVIENGFAIDPLQSENWALCLGDIEGL